MLQTSPIVPIWSNPDLSSIFPGVQDLSSGCSGEKVSVSRLASRNYIFLSCKAISFFDKSMCYSIQYLSKETSPSEPDSLFFFLQKLHVLSFQNKVKIGDAKNMKSIRICVSSFAYFVNYTAELSIW